MELGLTPIEWSADGKSLYYLQGLNDGVYELMSVPVTGGEPSSLGLKITRPWNLTAHPDGAHIAHDSYERTGEVWVMENFLPTAGD